LFVFYYVLGSVSLAGAETGLWSLHGGNKKIPHALLNASGASFHNEEVEAIHLNSDGRFSLRFKENDEMPLYDAVILATPVTNDTSMFGFENFPRQFHFPGRFHQTVCTMVQGDVNYETFQFADSSSVIDDIFTTNRTLFFNSLARNYPVDIDDGAEGAPSVWKVFSNEPLSKRELDILFSTINETFVIKWKAYPEYDGTTSTGNFTLHPGLYHINAIEFAASAMEMGIIGARNVALLAASHLGVDVQDRKTQSFHIEL
jgi:prenylcysteine oxidase/farnesylcysteine lyase